ncbi:MAG: hypothetical protein IAE77_24020 [Prosthecobacter sp.]|jgi:hypothetical protein|uniref:hypothetical protein n=1 Tax=Prosthecobacter sp. TaxID=1965333 RepID=UPI0019FD6C5C|nr:hypothetical protein [Prosthecobacter sp.]MBE2286546.1 hypothetical protein [Prosthecobacter sp.]
MPEPVSTLSLMFVGYAAIQPFARRGTAVSSEAQAVRRAASAVVSSAERSESLFGEKAELISQLWTLYDECSQHDWDGSNAMPMSGIAAAATAEFIKVLPSGVPLPELAPEPDGAISLDWIVSKRRVFSVSIGTSARLSFSWLDGADSGYAVARFDGMQVPQRILEGISAILGHENASIRFA